MARAVERMEGLAIAGAASVGSLCLRVPTVAWSERPEGAPVEPAAFPVRVRAGTAPPGRRAVTIATLESELPIEFPVPTPEVAGVPGAASRAAPGTWVVHAPLSAPQWEEVERDRPELIVWANARAQWRDGLPFVETIKAIRGRLGARPLVWAPRLGLPHRLAFLAYAGIDLVDSTEAAWLAASGTLVDGTLGAMPDPGPGGRPPCPCRFCTGADGGSLEGHSAQALAEERGRVEAALRVGRLRELVEARLTAEPTVAEMLRYLDREAATLLEERAPVVGSERRAYVLAESHRRPEMARFRDRFVERYRPPPSKEVLLLVPCSRTKPYRVSPSHRRLRLALDGLPHLERLHTVSITSPLGAVPRELEDVYPARQYDIPVTGAWDEDEAGHVRRAVAHLLATGRYRAVLVHLDPAEYDFLATALEGAPSVQWTASDHRTGSPEALDALHRAATGALDETRPVPGGPLAVVREELQEIASVQFGRSAGAALFAPPVRLVGRPWFQRLLDAERRDLASYREERGLFQLTVAGGRRLLTAGTLGVEVAADVALTGDLFAPGVARADAGIRIGDAVLLTRDGALLGVGEAHLPGPVMTAVDRGRAVEVRHRVHVAPGAPTQP